jgi:hypothetical protein
VPDDRDNCPSDANSDQEESDGDGVGDACDLDSPVGPGAYETSEEEEGYTIQPYPYSSSCRVKLQKFTYWFDQLGLRILAAFRYEGMFRVCYYPGSRIAWIRDVRGDVMWTRQPWTWKGNDHGYPYGVNYGRYAEAHYRGTAAICLFSKGCGPDKHPWIKITFYPNNTLRMVAGVA